MSHNLGVDPERAAAVVTHRAPVVERLSDGPKRNRTLLAELSLSRSTVYKALQELEELQLVHRGSDGYELTLTGRLLWEEHCRHEATVASICRPGGLLRVLPDDVDVPIGVLEGADVHLAERHAPIGPIVAIETLVREATELKGVGPVVLPNYVDLFHERLVEDELRAELVFERPAWEHLTRDYSGPMAESVATGNLTLWVTDDELPMGLLLVEEPVARVGMVIYDDDGGLKGVVENDAEEAYEWGHRMWNDALERATPVTTGRRGWELDDEPTVPPDTGGE